MPRYLFAFDSSYISRRRRHRHQIRRIPFQLATLLPRVATLNVHQSPNLPSFIPFPSASGCTPRLGTHPSIPSEFLPLLSQSPSSHPRRPFPRWRNPWIPLIIKSTTVHPQGPTEGMMTTLLPTTIMSKARQGQAIWPRALLHRLRSVMRHLHSSQHPFLRRLRDYRLFSNPSRRSSCPLLRTTRLPHLH